VAAFGSIKPFIMQTQTISYAGYILTVYPEKNSDGSFTGQWCYTIDDERTLSQVADGSDFNGSKYAEAAAREWVDGHYGK
jgi:hypothetical protein